MKNKNNSLIDTAIEVGSTSVGAITGMVAGNVVIGGAVGAAVGSYWGSVLTPIITDLAKRLLSPKELERMKLVQKLAKKKYLEKIDKKCKLRDDLSKEQLTQIAEGILLTSRDSYEEKKIPLLANLVATAPFTSTPIENLTQTLQEAERLSYRQLSLLAIIYKNNYGDEIGLSNLPFIEEKNKHFNEYIKGTYQDLNLMVVDGIIAMVVSNDAGPAMASGVNFIIPSKLKLLYPGDLLVDGLGLSGISNDDLKPLENALKTV